MENKYKIVADQDIPFIEGIFEPYAEVVYMVGKDITAEDVKDADALLIRTRTKCDQSLLEGSKIKIISTATIGTDHIDLEYCKKNFIKVSNAQGCNAGGVMQYVFSSLYGISSRKNIKLDGATFGIIGVGTVGKLVEKMALYLGFNVLRCDPPRAELEGEEGFNSLDYLLENSDVVTIHTPLDETTKNMANDEFFRKMKPGAIFINAARGEIVDEAALKAVIPKLGSVIIDTWNNEPNVDEELIEMVDIATPHIAGYSYQGKRNGSAFSVRSIARWFGFTSLHYFYPRPDHPDRPSIKLDLKGKNQGEITAVFQYNYPIFTDDFMFRIAPNNFEKMRAEYKYRTEIYVE